jgi:peptidoglycan hydrolase-like protein with peptidoglycan-binding domain
VEHWLYTWCNDRPLEDLDEAVEAFVSSQTRPQTQGHNARVMQIQEKLATLGYDPGPPDGLIGPRTRAAIRKFQEDQGMDVTGEASLTVLFGTWTELAGKIERQPRIQQ